MRKSNRFHVRCFCFLLLGGMVNGCSDGTQERDSQSTTSIETSNRQGESELLNAGQFTPESHSTQSTSESIQRSGKHTSPNSGRNLRLILEEAKVATAVQDQDAQLLLRHEILAKGSGVRSELEAAHTAAREAYLNALDRYGVNPCPETERARIAANLYVAFIDLVLEELDS